MTKQAAIKAPTYPLIDLDVSADDLRHALTMVRPCGARQPVPILTYARIGDGRLSATDLDTEASFDLDMTGSGTVMLPIRRLLKAVKCAEKGERVTIRRIDPTDYRVVVRVGDLVFGLATLPVEDYPAMRGFKAETAFFAFPENVLGWLIGGVRHAISTEETRYCLNGVCLQQTDGRVVAVATDGRVLAARHLRTEQPAPFPDGGIIVPHEVVAMLGALAKGGEEVGLEFAECRADWRGKGWTLKTRLIDGRFPNWRRVVAPRCEEKATVEIDRARITKALKAMGVVGTAALALKLAEGCRVDAQSRYVDDTMAIEGIGRVSGEFTEIGINPKYLRHMLAVSGTGALTLRFHGSNDPMYFDGADFHDIHVVMPMRV